MNNILAKLNWRKWPLGTRWFWRRTVVFLAFYTILAWFQPNISELLWQTSFTTKDKFIAYLIYPIFFVIGIFCIEKIKTLPNWHWRGWQGTLFFVLGIVCLFFPLQVIRQNVAGNFSLINVVHFTFFYFGFLFIFLAIFNLKFFNYFFREIALVSSVYIGYVVLEILLNNFWQYFSGIIIFSLEKILPLFASATTFNASSFNVTLNDFSVNIGPVCAGFYSLVTFAFLFLIALFLLGNKKKIRWFWSAVALLAGLVVVFILNVLRVAIIILVGGYISKDLAINLFHEYLGAVFLIGIFLVYLYYAIPRLVAKGKE